MRDSYGLYDNWSQHKCSSSVRTNVKFRPKARRIDPTQTTILRKDYAKEFNRRFQILIRMIEKEVRKGLANPSDLQTNKKYDFPTDQGKIAAFDAWLSRAIDKALFDDNLSASRDIGVKRYWGNTFATIAYRKGLMRSVSAIKRAGGKVAPAYVKEALSRGFHAQTLERLYTRQYDGLKRITNEMSRQIGTVLAETLAQGKGVDVMARAIVDRVEKIGRTRAFLLARTEVVSAFNESQLTTFQEAGINDVEIEPELLTAEDDRVCEQCEEASSRTYTIETAKGVIPLHPNCRCAWSPIIRDGKEVDLQ